MNGTLIIGTRQGIFTARRNNGEFEILNSSLNSLRVNSLSVLECRVLAGTRDGIYKSDDQGTSFVKSSDGLTQPHIRWLAYDPGGTGWALAGTEPAAIFISQDGGESWRECPEVAEMRDKNRWYLPYSPESGCVRGFAFHGKRVYAAVEVGGLLYSDDKGETWELVEGSRKSPSAGSSGGLHPDVHSVEVHPSSKELIFAPTGGGFYITKDGGVNWKNVYHGYCRAVWGDPDNPEDLILGPADNVDRNGRIERTMDGGKSWESASGGLEVPWPKYMVERFARFEDDLLAVLSNGDLFISPPDRFQWKQILPDIGWVNAVAELKA